MAPKKPAVTSKALQALLTRIGSALSGTKSTLLHRFQHDVPSSYHFRPQSTRNESQPEPWGHKVRVMSIDMGIRNLAFCDAEVSYPAAELKSEQDLNATMNVLRWKKLDLVEGQRYHDSHQQSLEDIQENIGAAGDDISQFTPSVLSKTAYRLITEEVLSVNPDIILIEKQRWRSGGGSAVQQWTVRVNTLEAMLWAILETLKMTRQSRYQTGKFVAKQDFHVRAVDPKRVGQYWLGQHARALGERDEDALAINVAGLSKGAKEPEDAEEEETGKIAKKPSRGKAEKSAKIAILRLWLADDTMSTVPSTPSSMPHITFGIGPDAASTRQALLPKVKRRNKGSKAATKDAGQVENISVTEIKKLDDITDCFLQAAAWIAWESNRLQLMALSNGGKLDPSKHPSTIDEDQILKMIKEVGEV
ncbi:ribonuclease H-like protein [Macroventuria anomochaeta]|uniref:Ribonuclease H-like protein n=1 Tax=Macroventuria anomochaeta TaxID=301207 RepID=A0ACB6RUB1_9PLEO|nr:ribonuclease H-like protein [Macroventuria anomochaeta]KAF2625307.1 ribonuclease H-like protein [Macroventuria anomochaeta]